MGKRLSALSFCLWLALLGQGWGKEKLSLETIFGGEPLEGKPAVVSFVPDGSGLYLLKTQDQETILIKEDWEGGQTVLLREGQLQLPEQAQRKLPLASFTPSPTAGAVLLNDGQDLFMVELASGHLRQLTNSPEPEQHAAFSPDGAWVSFVRGNDLFVVQVATSEEQRLTFDGSETRLNGALDWVYTEELYNRHSSGYAWSPDSQHLLYLSFDLSAVPRYPLVDLLQRHPEVSFLRYPKAGDTNATVTVNVVSLDGDAASSRPGLRLGFSGPQREYVARFGWLPSGKRFWLLLLSRDQKDAELVTFDLSLGYGQTVLKEHDDAWLNVKDDILWTKAGVLVFGSERSGFRHLYRLEPGSRQPRPLTSGNFDVTGTLCLDQKEELLYFVAAHPTPLQRHLFRVPLEGGPLEQLTKEAGTHALRAAPFCQAFLDSFSTATQLPETRLLDRSGRLRRIIPYEKGPQLDRFSLGTISFHELEGPSGHRLYASLLKPADFDPRRRYPVVVYVYGGPHAQVVRDGWGGRTALFHHFLTQQGFLVFSLDNRGSTARGRAFERALAGRLGKAELEDQLAGWQWLSQQPYVDSRRIGLWGWSYGGYMTLYALTHTTAFRAGVAVAPVTDWRLYDTIYTERYLKLPAQNEEGYRESSPISAAGNLSAPLLIIHGTGDDNVHWQNTLSFVGALVQAGQPYRLLLYPNQNHGIPGKRERLHLFSAIYQHFLEHLTEKTQPSR